MADSLAELVYRPGRRRQQGVVLIAVTVALLMIALGVSGIYMLARQAEQTMQPRMKSAALKSFGKELVELCGNFLLVIEGTYATGVSDIDAFIQDVNDDPEWNLRLTQNPSPDLGRLPPGTLGNSGIEQELYATFGTDSIDPYQDAAMWRFDRDASGNYVADVVAQRGELIGWLDLDFIGGDAASGSTGGGGGGGTRGCTVFKWGEGLKCGKKVGNKDEGINNSVNPVASVFRSGLYRCRVDAQESGSGEQLIIEAIIRK